MPAAKAPRRPLAVDYRSDVVPAWVRDVLEAHLAIEREDAKSAGALGFMARALVIATMPYKDPRVDVFQRVNGKFRLRILAGYEGGIPYGIYPRLLLSWVATEAVKKQSPVLELGDSLREFLRDVLNLRSSGGGERGSGARVVEQMKRLFGSLVTADYTGDEDARGFALSHVMIAERMNLTAKDQQAFSALGEDSPDDAAPPALAPKRAKDTVLWTPQAAHEAGKWRSQVVLSPAFFSECVAHPVPLDMRAYRALRGSPLAMDVYTWLSYRLSYTTRRTKPIAWEALMWQFGSDYSTAPEQAVRDFRKAFLKALHLVQIVYPQANVDVTKGGLVLMPSRPHVAYAPPPRAKTTPQPAQGELFGDLR